MSTPSNYTIPEYSHRTGKERAVPLACSELEYSGTGTYLTKLIYVINDDAK
jgi:hypothetical protein